MRFQCAIAKHGKGQLVVDIYCRHSYNHFLAYLVIEITVIWYGRYLITCSITFDLIIRNDMKYALLKIICYE